jgi:predicted dehydrogenase
LRFGERNFFPFATTVTEELLSRRDIDLVIIATPPATHEDLVIRALDAGKYVICEKPLAHTLSSADRIITHANKTPGRLSVAYQLRFDLDYQRLAWLMSLREFQGPRKVFCRRVTPLNRRLVTQGWWGQWKIAGGGAVMTQFIHQLDALGHMFGAPDWVEAELESTTPGLESEDTCRMQIGFGNVLADCFCSVAPGSFENSLRVEGDFGEIELPWKTHLVNGNEAVQLASQRFPVARAPSRLKQLMHRGSRKVLRTAGLAHWFPQPKPFCSHEPYLSQVIEAIFASQALPNSAVEARNSLELTTAIYGAGVVGHRLRLPLSPQSIGYYGFFKSAKGIEPATSAEQFIERVQC